MVSAAHATAGGQSVRYGALWWDETASAVAGAAWLTASLAAGASPARPAISGATVALLGLLFRFDGARWNSADAARPGEPGATQLVAGSVGLDLYARLFSAASGQIADLLVYDPLAGTWAVPAGLAVSGPAPLAAAAPSTGGPGNYAVVGTQLWHRAANGTWSSVLTLPAGLSAADLATLRLLADRVLIVQQGTGGATPKTLAYVLANGGVRSGSPIALNGQRFVPDATGDAALAGRRAFATYTGSYGAAGSTLTLYRPLAGDVEGTQTGYAVATLTTDNGYGSLAGASGLVPTAIACNGTGATVDETGDLPRFNQTTLAPGTASHGATPNGSLVYGFYNGLSSGETPAQAWPSAQYSNALDYRAAASGLLFTVLTRDPEGTTVAANTTSWQLTAGTLGQAGRSVYARAVRQEDLCDGATGISTTAYSGDTGFPSEVAVETTNAAGTVDRFGVQLTYWWQIYDVPRATNLLAPVVQARRTSTPAGGTQTTVGLHIETWRSDWGAGAGRWAPDRTFLATSASPPAFNAWQPADPAPAGYLLQQRVLARTPEGLPLAVVDALGRSTSETYDTSRTYSVATVENCPADATMFSWFGCEPYESSGAWSCADPARTIWSFVTGADFHTGSQCLSLPPGTTAGPLLAVLPSNQARSYVFSCWARTPAGFLPAQGIAQWTIQPYDPASGQAVGQPITLVLTPAGGAKPTAVGTWDYLSGDDQPAGAGRPLWQTRARPADRSRQRQHGGALLFRRATLRTARQRPARAGLRAAALAAAGADRFGWPVAAGPLRSGQPPLPRARPVRPGRSAGGVGLFAAAHAGRDLPRRLPERPPAARDRGREPLLRLPRRQ